MASCSKCGKRLERGAVFCSKCGQPVEANNDGSRRKQVFQGSVLKCPNCGETLKAFQSKCPTCGYEFRNAKSSDAVREFSEKLEQIELGQTGSLLSGLTNPFGRKKKKEEQVLNHIRNFSVPNTKEDVFEFSIMAASNINMSAISADITSDAGANSSEELNSMIARNEAWLAKLQQVYQKAKLSFGNDPDFSEIQRIYEKTIQSIEEAKREKNKKERKRAFSGWIGLAVMGAVCVLFFAGAFISHNNHERELERIYQEIQTDIAAGDYETALIKAQSLHMDDNFSSESKERWDKQRGSIIQLIEQKMGSQ